MSLARAALLASLGLAAGCATTTTTGQARELELPAVEVRAGSPERVALAALNVEELFQVGMAAHTRGDYERAAMAFESVIAGHPDSPRVADAHFNAGLSWERMGESLRAVDHFLLLLGHQDGSAWEGAALRASDNLYHLEAYADAAALLHELAERSRHDPDLRIEALVKEGVCLLEMGRDVDAESRLRQALGRYHLERREDEDSLDTLYPAQGQFFLGEVYRLRFESGELDAAQSLEGLEADLTAKGALLLSAQGHYLRAIRMGEAKWAAAAGYELGRLYEIFHRQITRARLPLELKDPAERLAYQQVLQAEVRALLEKALSAYERTLATAERIGVQGRWRERIEAGLDRVRSLLLEETLAPEPEPEPPTGTVPTEGEGEGDVPAA
ncbi:MAG: hypothetical protein P1V51_11720 [Deltaproteobacteria bacterium]|nr:hypothetical protein [Deltaproteobacteria bacterium]